MPPSTTFVDAASCTAGRRPRSTGAPAPRIPRRAVITRVPLATAIGLSALAGLKPLSRRPALAQGATPQPPLAGVLVTLSATAEEIDPAALSGGLMLRITLDNQSGADAADLRVRVPLPARSRVAGSSQGGAVAGDAIIWSGLRLRVGERMEPLSFRLLPEPGADGAVIFRDVRVQPEVTWISTSGIDGKAEPPSLRLLGLWGEGGTRRTILPTGLTVFTVERPDSPSVALRMAVRAGSRDEDDTTTGGSHWLEHAFFLGTARRPNNQAIFGDIEKVGGQLNASTSYEVTDYYNLVPADQFDLGLDVLADQLLNSTFSPAAFERERRVVFQEHKLVYDAPSSRATIEFLTRVFQVSPLRRHPIGNPDAFLTLPVPSILRYKQERYVTGNMAIAVSGRLTHDEAVAKIERAFAGLPRGPRSARPRVVEPVQTDLRRTEIGEGTRTAEIRLGWPGPGDLGEDSPAMYVLEDILGTLGRRLADDIRDRRALAASVGINYAAFSDSGAVILFASTQADRVQDVIDALLSHIQRLRDGEVTAAEVQAGLRALIGSQPLAAESNLGRAANFSRGDVTDTLEAYEEYVARLRRVTPADVQRVAQKYLNPAAYTLVVVRP